MYSPVVPYSATWKSLNLYDNSTSCRRRTAVGPRVAERKMTSPARAAVPSENTQLPQEELVLSSLTAPTQTACEPSMHVISTVADVAAHFQVQGIRHEACTDRLWCSLCTVARDGGGDSGGGGIRNDNTRSRSSGAGTESFPPLEELLCFIGHTKDDVLSHCATRGHLLRFEKNRLCGLHHWCPVELHGERLLLDHHCLYPEQMFGPGRMIMDETIAGGILLGQDVCGGVKLWPKHRYSVVELVLPQAESFVQRVSASDEATSKLPAESNEDASQQQAVNVFYELANVNRAVAAQREEAETRRKPSLREKSVRTDGVCKLPSFYRRGHGVRSLRVQVGDIAHALRDVNKFIRGEAAYRKRRTERFAKDNM